MEAARNKNDGNNNDIRLTDSLHVDGMVNDFLTDLWNGFINIHLPVWANEYNGINVIAGPIFDFDFNGFRDHKNITDEG